MDTEPPEILRLAPASYAIAVGLKSPLKAYLRDETGIDPVSIVFAVGTNPPVTLADPRLTFANGVLTYTPATNEFLGAQAQTVTSRLIVADILGYRVTNLWSFQLELPAVLAANAVLLGGPAGAALHAAAASGLTLVSTNGDTFVFSYTGASSGLTNGQILVSTDTNFTYKRKVISAADDPGSHTVSVLTEQASLAECIQQGSLRLVGDFSTLPPEAGLEPASLGASISLNGTVIYDNGTIKVEIVSGQITFNPDFTISGTFDGKRLTAFDTEISAMLGLTMTVQGRVQVMGDFDGSAALTTPRRTFRLLGFIGPVPVWVEAVLEFNIGYEAHLEAQGKATWGFESSRTLTFGARLRDGQWSRYEVETTGYVPYAPGWEITGAARLQTYLQPKLTVYLESLVGPSADLKPYLELEGKACVEPGQAGVDLSLYAGLSSTLAIAVRGWDKDWGNLPSWELFNVRRLLSHTNLTTPIGSPPQIIPNMVWIPCGTFTMGSPDSEPARFSSEGPQTLVTISRGFWMERYEVTQGEYLAVMGVNPSFFTAANGYGTNLSRPVEQVSWNDAVAYCAALTTRERNAGRLLAGYVYRLPTEAEWEYACRAGTVTAFHYGNALRSGMANFYGLYEYPPCGGDPYICYNSAGTYLRHTATVGSYAANAWGLYDMHGNVWEWCSDWWSESLPGGSVTDPQGAPTGWRRVVRGGGWAVDAIFCRSANRDSYGDPAGSRVVGFRVVLAPGQQ